MPRWYIWIWLLLALFGLLLALPVRGDEYPRIRVQRLAQMAVAEVSLGPDIPRRMEWAAMMHVIDRRARKLGIPVEEMVCRYCAAWNDECRFVGSRSYIPQLELVGMMPPDWPDEASWPKHRLWWLDAVEMAERFVNGRVPDPCRGEPMYFGAPYDVAPPHWRRVCRRPGFRQVYWK
jgi:hypothetical protein